MDRKRNALLVPGRDVPLIQIGLGRWDYQHMLKERDFDPVNQVVDYLVGQEMRVYLGGGVTENWVYGGNTNYKDIDLMVVSDPLSRGTLNTLGAFERAMFDGRGIQIGKRAFTFVNRDGGLKKHYMNMPKIHFRKRVELLPVPTIEEVRSHPGEFSSKIDLIFYGMPGLKKSWTPSE